MSASTSTTGSTASLTYDDVVWRAWNQLRAASWTMTVSSTSSTTCDLTWREWNTQYTAIQTAITVAQNAATNVYTNQTWGVWNDEYERLAADRENQVRREIIAGRQPSAEQRERWRREEQERREAEAKRQAEVHEAKRKAEVLLTSCLSKQQREEYAARGCFHLHVGDEVYRIEKGSHGNVKLIDKDGKVKRSFCVQPRGVPDGDAMLAQKLLLETDKKRFYELSNVTEYADGRALRTLAAPRGAELLRELQQATQ